MSLQFTWMLAFIVIGAGWYVVDRSIGIGFYRWWYDMTHRDPMPADVNRGFIYNQPAKVRFTAAVAIAVIQSATAVLDGSGDFSIELLSVFLEVPVIMLGFFAGPRVYAIWGDRERLLDRVDELERDGVSVSDHLRSATRGAATAVKSALDDLRSRDEAEPAEGTPTTAPAEEPSVESRPNAGVDRSEKEPDAQQLMNRYLRRD